MSNLIDIPEVLVEQKTFCLKIDQCNRKMFHHIDYLRKLITNMHQIYQKLCKKIIQESDELERELIKDDYACNHGAIIFNFVKKINIIHLTMSNQLNSNSVTLGTKTYKIAKNRLQLLGEKLSKCNQLNKLYLQRVEVYNDKEKTYQQKCQYFNDYEKDVLKYYSLKANYELYEKMKGKEDRLREKQENIYRIKDQYTASIAEIRISIKQFFQMEKLIVIQYKKLLLNIRKGASQQRRQVYNDPILEVNEEGTETNYQDTIPPTTRRADRENQGVKQITAMRQVIITQFENCQKAQELLDNFLQQMQDVIVSTGQAIDEMRSGSDYRRFISDKIMMLQILSIDSITDIDAMINQIAFFRMIMLNVNSLFSKTRILNELKKYRRLNYQKFIDETHHYVEMQKKEGSNIHWTNEYLVFQNKFHDNNNQYTTRFRDQISKFQSQIISKYFSEQSRVTESKTRFIRNELFQKKYYQILMNSFFLKNEHYNFIENVFLSKFGRHLNANKIQKMMTMTDFFKTNRKGKMGCCGFFFSGEEEGPLMLDDFHCALKDGYILIQGKLKFYRNYILFSSNFNSKTLFGYSDIRIPKWDIIHFGREKHLLSLMLVIETTHGNLQFTSFLTDPFEKLNEIYDDRKSGVSMIGHVSGGDNQLQILQECFQRELQVELKRVGIIIDKLSTYLSEDNHKLSISIEYHPEGLSYTLLFQIKFNLNQISLQYFFIHDQKATSSQIKNRLEEIAKSIINSDPDNKEFQVPQQKNNLNLSYSMIAPNQTNRISLLREPSFMNEEQHSLHQHQPQEEIGLGTALDLAHLLSSRNVNTPSIHQTQKNNNFEQELSIFKNQGSQQISKNMSNSFSKKSMSNLEEKVTCQAGKASMSSVNKQIKNSRSSSASTKGGVSSSFLLYFLLGVFLLNIFVKWFT